MRARNLEGGSSVAHDKVIARLHPWTVAATIISCILSGSGSTGFYLILDSTLVHGDGSRMIFSARSIEKDKLEY